ncbi:hypothetical protein CTA2_2597, partial [Colletotrichum tanaceti]
PFVESTIREIDKKYIPASDDQARSRARSKKQSSKPAPGSPIPRYAFPAPLQGADPRPLPLGGRARRPRGPPHDREPHRAQGDVVLVRRPRPRAGPSLPTGGRRRRRGGRRRCSCGDVQARRVRWVQRVRRERERRRHPWHTSAPRRQKEGRPGNEPGTVALPLEVGRTGRGGRDEEEEKEEGRGGREQAGRGGVWYPCRVRGRMWSRGRRGAEEEEEDRHARRRNARRPEAETGPGFRSRRGLGVGAGEPPALPREPGAHPRGVDDCGVAGRLVGSRVDPGPHRFPPAQHLHHQATHPFPSGISAPVPHSGSSSNNDDKNNPPVTVVV